MFKTILIANRGEIALRINRTAQRMGIRTVAVYSDADRYSPHVSACDRAVRVGPPPVRESYLAIDALIAACKETGADAVHPGYGFLSENAHFARALEAEGIVFIGPHVEAISMMGDKIAANRQARTAGVPTIPGHWETIPSADDAVRIGQEIGFPVMLKAAAGGGGKGMRVVERAAEFADQLAAAKRESKASFGDDRVLLERYLQKPRHIEVQVFADTHGNVIHLFERDCSLQRRHQKIVEEAPAPGLDPRLRTRMGETAVTAARAVGYVGAGTVEFLLAPDGAFYFMEMNTRLQVEHPVTEMILGLDLVDWQLRVAAGEPLPAQQNDLAIGGHAIEVRIYAEDPDRDFLPAAGTLAHLRFPAETAHVRVDTGVREGDAVGTFYDPMIAKLIAWDTTRAAAIARLRTALAETLIVGPHTNVPFLAGVASFPPYVAGDVHTAFIDEHRHDLFPEQGPVSARVLALATLFVLLRRDSEARSAAAKSEDPHSPWHETSGWRLNDDNHHVLTFLDGDRSIEVTIHYRASGLELEIPGEDKPLAASGSCDEAGDVVATLDGIRLRATVVRRGDFLTVFAGGVAHRLELLDPAARAEVQEATGGGLTAPMPGKVIAVRAAAGDSVVRGAILIVLEAMKTENAITAPADGKVAAVHYDVGDQVEEGAELVSFEQDDTRGDDAA